MYIIIHKGPYITKELYKHFKKNIKNKKIKIFNKSLTITKELLGSIVEVYNGNKFISLFIDKKKLGQKIGKFIFTKKLKSVKNINVK